jgi:hypothetical protein
MVRQWRPACCAWPRSTPGGTLPAPQRGYRGREWQARTAGRHVWGGDAHSRTGASHSTGGAPAHQPFPRLPPAPPAAGVCCGLPPPVRQERPLPPGEPHFLPCPSSSWTLLRHPGPWGKAASPAHFPSTRARKPAPRPALPCSAGPPILPLTFYLHPFLSNNSGFPHDGHAHQGVR